ncbi:poly(A)-specific ribonuclease PARN-like [Impatiens glandulifera]|uniref:poly(A)-specific ribonuclease PARN-like n=1 Tax=Impatiens glandulifera TaxID=253017 RepID=UPI001FB06B9F|nr:poly(A)-specific ribonuclease PARN-like [Impatiens glandulifera]
MMKLQWLVKPLCLTLTKGSTIVTSRLYSSSPTSTTIKNVTRSNFEPVLSDLRSLINDAVFVSIDLEMTGVTSAPWRESFEFDRSDIRYLKVKDSAEKFAVVQFGVCPFRWDSSKGSFIAHPHNFYIFPRQESSEFLCQTTSIDFLAKYQFDFNICIQEGISYLSRAQEEEALRHLHSLQDDDDDEFAEPRTGDKDKPLTRIADILFSERIKGRVQEWLNRLLQNGSYHSSSKEILNESDKQFQTVFFKMRPALQLNEFTRHQLRLIQSVTEKHFKELVYIRMKSGRISAQHYLIYTETDSDRNLLKKEVKEDSHKVAELNIEGDIGFRHIIDILCSEKKLIVGHNCFLDIAHIHSKFLGPLPSTVEEYVSSIHKCFPYIIDTKILLNANDAIRQKMKNNSTSLSKAFALLCTEISPNIEEVGLVFNPDVKVEVQVDDMRSSNWNCGAKHEAGYDAFMTGSVFAQACSYLGFDFELNSPSGNLKLNEKLKNYINLLYLSWINGEIINLTTCQQIAESSLNPNQKLPCPEIVFENIIIIWGLSSKVKARDIQEWISKTFGPLSVTSVYQLDETAVFVQFSKEEFVSGFLELKKTLAWDKGPISVLHPLSRLFESGGMVRTGNYEMYKEMCGSIISKVKFADQADFVAIK